VKELEPLENLYFDWLYAKLARIPPVRRTLSTTYDTLLKTLHNVEFHWIVVGDDNRAEDGRDLRVQFLITANIPDYPEWRTQPCSVLEMLVAFCEKAHRQTDEPVHQWFWEIMENLNLAEANDASDFTPEDIQEVLEDLIFRNYRENGDGGLFPLNEPTRDQRDIEIWDQFCDYLVDRNRLP
jgi:hypothetical protein